MLDRRDLLSRGLLVGANLPLGEGMIVHKTTNAVARKTSLLLAVLLLPGSALTMHFYCKPSGRFSRFLFPPPPPSPPTMRHGLDKRIKALNPEAEAD
jgi:hypothetical protein